MFWLIDLGAVILIGLMTYLGYKKGFIKALIGLVGFLIALLLAKGLSEPISEMVYDTFISDALKSYVTSYIDSLTGQADLGGAQPLYMAGPGTKASISYQDLLGQLQKSGDSLTSSEKAEIIRQIQKGATVEEIVSQHNKSTGSEVNAADVAKALGVDKKSSVSEATEEANSIFGIDVGKIVGNIIAEAVDVDSISAEVIDKNLHPMIVNILSSIVFIVLFIIFSLLLGLLSGAVSKLVNKVPLVGPVNKVLGGAFGFAKGLGWTIILLIILTMMARGSDNADFRKSVDRSLGCTLVESLVPDFSAE